MKYSRLTGASLADMRTDRSRSYFHEIVGMVAVGLSRMSLVLVLLGTILGCRAAVTTDPDPDPPEAALTLQGTWIWRDSYVDDDDGRTYQEVQVVTFTGDGRAISYNAVDDDTGARIDEWQEPEGWTATDSTITQTWLDDHDDDDETPEIRREQVRSYYWQEGRQALFLEPGWSAGEGSAPYRYTRVEDPLAALIGTTWNWRRTPGAFSLAGTLMFNADGTFVVESVRPDSTHRLAGAYTWDAEALALVGSDMTLTITPADGGAQSTEAFEPDGPFRWAVAPTDTPTTIIVSAPHIDVVFEFGDYRDWYDAAP